MLSVFRLFFSISGKCYIFLQGKISEQETLFQDCLEDADSSMVGNL